MPEPKMKAKLGFVCVSMSIQTQSRNQLIKHFEVEDISFSELNKSRPDLSRLDVVVVEWDANSEKLRDSLAKLRANWINRRILIVALGVPERWEENIAVELGITDWINANTISPDLLPLAEKVKEHQANAEIYDAIEAKAEQALAKNDYAEFKSVLDSAMFIDPRNRVYVEYLGELLVKDNNHEEALKLYNRVLINQPNAIRLLARVGDILTTLARYAEAKVYYEKAEEAANKMIEDVLLPEGRKKITGGPEALTSALSQLNSEDRVLNYISNRVQTTKETDGESKALEYFKKVKKSSDIKAIKDLDYEKILNKKSLKESDATLDFTKKKKSTKDGGTLNYDDLKKKAKIDKLRKLKKNG